MNIDIWLNPEIEEGRKEIPLKNEIL